MHSNSKQKKDRISLQLGRIYSQWVFWPDTVTYIVNYTIIACIRWHFIAVLYIVSWPHWSALALLCHSIISCCENIALVNQKHKCYSVTELLISSLANKDYFDTARVVSCVLIYSKHFKNHKTLQDSYIPKQCRWRHTYFIILVPFYSKDTLLWW